MSLPTTGNGVTFNYNKFFNDIAVMEFFMGVANIISGGIEMSKYYDGRNIILVYLAMGISGYLTLYSCYPCCIVKQPEKIRKQLNKYCWIVCIMSAVQFGLYLANSIMTSWQLISFWVSFCTTITSYLVIFYFYLCTKAAKKQEYVRPGVYPGATPITAPAETRTTGPSANFALTHTATPTAPGLDQINSRSDDTPSYNDVIRHDPPKYITSVIDDLPPTDELPPPPSYTEAMQD